MRIVDLFCGMGGVAEATRVTNETEPPSPSHRRPYPASKVVAAIDIDTRIRAIYEHNHGVTVCTKTLESIEEIPDAELWWLSPPCQPHTQRRGGRDADDHRSAALSHLIDLVERDRPERILLENVPPFLGSVHHLQLVNTLNRAGYSVRQDLLCPTQCGIPMRRRRFYLRALRHGREIPEVNCSKQFRPLRCFLDESAWEDVALQVAPALREQYSDSMHVIDVDNEFATATCFTSAYGKSHIRSGAYLHCARRALTRRFSPAEISRLLGFRDVFWWPDTMTTRTRYRLLGNSLSVPIVRRLLATMHEH